jgi:hypothetical protein
MTHIKGSWGVERLPLVRGSMVGVKMFCFNLHYKKSNLFTKSTFKVENQTNLNSFPTTLFQHYKRALLFCGLIFHFVEKNRFFSQKVFFQRKSEKNTIFGTIQLF